MKVVITLLLPQKTQLGFALLDENELQQLSNKRRNKNAMCSTKFGFILTKREQFITGQKNIDFGKYSPFELNQAYCQLRGELRRVDVPNLLEILISLLFEMCSQLQLFYIFFYLLGDPIENDFMQSVINKELHVFSDKWDKQP